MRPHPIRYWRVVVASISRRVPDWVLHVPFEDWGIASEPKTHKARLSRPGQFTGVRITN